MLKIFKRLFKATELKPGAFGFSLDIKALFGAQRGGAQAIYKALIMDLNTAEKALREFSQTGHSQNTLQHQLRIVIKDVEPICATKAKLAEIDDADTRVEIDSICSIVEEFKNHVNPNYYTETKFEIISFTSDAAALGLAKQVSKLSKRLASR